MQLTDNYGPLADIHNEAGVEAHFMMPLLTDLGYKPADMMLKETISALPVGQGRRKVLYRPDAILKVNGIPAIVVDAKAPDESLEAWESQCSSYCLEINRMYEYNPVQYFILTSAVSTRVYLWDRNDATLTLSYDDVVSEGAEYGNLLQLVSRASVAQMADQLKEAVDEQFFEFEPITLEALGEKFKKLHHLIWRTEKKSPSSAFTELMKIIFVKISKDRELHEKLGDRRPKFKDVVFSSHWVSAQSESAHPINDPLFKNLLGALEAGIASGSKKRFFDVNESINISADTVLRVVKEIENIDFFTMEEDIHGRLFESFLDATVRGKDIGQFFTPRDVVNLMVDLADPKVSKTHIDSVLDACCGSGGFLIASMRDMITKSDQLANTTSRERESIRKKIREQSIFGIDAGSDPAMYRIARMNMYLHGDGGSRIYFADSLDKEIGRVGSESLENTRQLEEVRQLVKKDGKKFDVILSNPPFSLKYSRDDTDQARVLNQYDLSIDTLENTVRNSLLSSVMYVELYKDLVADNGRILAVIDDSVLSGESYAHIRKFIRDSFIIQGIISLPGDAFRRSAARVKTSVIMLKKKSAGEVQEDAFMYSARYLGLEHDVAKRIGIDPSELIDLKAAEHKAIVDGYARYLQGEHGSWSIPFSNMSSRLDVKYCINDRGRKVPEWQAKGYSDAPIGEVLTLAEGRKVSLVEDDVYRLLRVSYEGEIGEGEELTKESSSYAALYQVDAWDLLISNMGIGRGAVGIVPPHHAGKFVSNEYTIVRAPSKEAAVFYANLLRTKEVLGDMLSLTTGMNRGRVKWDVISQVVVPVYDEADSEVVELVKGLETFWASYGVFAQNQRRHVDALVERFDVDDEDAHVRWLGFKPPE